MPVSKVYVFCAICHLKLKTNMCNNENVWFSYKNKVGVGRKVGIVKEYYRNEIVIQTITS